MGVGLLQTALVAVDLRVAQLLPEALGPMLAAVGSLKVSQLAPMLPYALMVAMGVRSSWARSESILRRVSSTLSSRALRGWYGSNSSV